MVAKISLTIKKAITIFRNALSVLREFFVNVFFKGITEMLFSLAEKRTMSKSTRATIYSVTLLPLAALFIYFIAIKFNVESSLDIVLLYFFTACAVVSYFWSLKIIFKK